MTFRDMEIIQLEKEEELSERKVPSRYVLSCSLSLLSSEGMGGQSEIKGKAEAQFPFKILPWLKELYFFSLKKLPFCFMGNNSQCLVFVVFNMVNCCQSLGHTTISSPQTRLLLLNSEPC